MMPCANTIGEMIDMKIKETTLNSILSIMLMFMTIFALCVGGYIIRDETSVGILWIGTGVFMIATFWNHKRLKNVWESKDT